MEYYPADEPYKYYKQGPVWYAECTYAGCDSGKNGAPYRVVRKMRPQIHKPMLAHIGVTHYGKLALAYEDSQLKMTLDLQPAPRYNATDPVPF